MALAHPERGAAAGAALGQFHKLPDLRFGWRCRRAAEDQAHCRSDFVLPGQTHLNSTGPKSAGEKQI